ncbi:unknown [Clostridium sp. CAG:609]|nr:unknown [Clostridium sp. CAG:609]
MIPSITYKNKIKDIEIGQNSTDGKNTSDLMKIGLMYESDYGFAAEPSAWFTTLDKYSQSSVTLVN